MPNGKDVERAVGKTDKFLGQTVSSHQKKLDAAIGKLEASIVDRVKSLKTDGRGRLIGPRVNLKQAQTVHGELASLFQETYGRAVTSNVGGFQKVVSQIKSTYKDLDVAVKFAGIDADVIVALRDATYEQYAAFGTSAQARISSAMYEHVVAQAPFSTLVASVQGALTGHKSIVGRPMVMYADQFALDSVMNFHRSVNVRAADRAGLSHYLYVGDVITSTRDFCEERAGKVFTRAEVLSWDKLKWKGKAGPVLTYAGGYRCRHHLQGVDPTWLET